MITVRSKLYLSSIISGFKVCMNNCILPALCIVPPGSPTHSFDGKSFCEAFSYQCALCRLYIQQITYIFQDLQCIHITVFTE